MLGTFTQGLKLQAAADHKSFIMVPGEPRIQYPTRTNLSYAYRMPITLQERLFESQGLDSARNSSFEIAASHWDAE